MCVCVAVTVDSWRLESKFCMNNNSNNKIVTNTICTTSTVLTRLHRAWHVCKIHADKSLNYSKLYEIWYNIHITSRKLKLSEDWQLMALDQTRFRNLFSLYPISRFVCFESETERNPRMQFFVRNPREGHTKLIRNIPITTDKLIYEIVINFDINVRENRREIKNRQSRDKGNTGRKTKKNNLKRWKTQREREYVFILFHALSICWHNPRRNSWESLNYVLKTGIYPNCFKLHCRMSLFRRCYKQNTLWF